MESKGSMITDWLDEYGDEKIEKEVETKLFMEETIRIIKETPNDMELGKKIREWYNQTHTNKNYINPYSVESGIIFNDETLDVDWDIYGDNIIASDIDKLLPKILRK